MFGHIICQLVEEKIFQMFDTLFLDRDGVINEKLENKYVTCIKEFVFIDGVLESFTTISKFFKRVIILLTNKA